MVTDRKVIALTGIAGSGKTSIATALASLLGYEPVLSFDDYFEFLLGWPEDIREWLDSGADISSLSNPRLVRDVYSLLSGKSIIYPTTNKMLHAKEFIILEDPSGRERPDIAPYIDYLIFIDTPPDIGLMRVLTRWMNRDFTSSSGSTGRFRDVAPDVLFDQLMQHLTDYLEYYRDLYVTICDRARLTADLVIDGLQDISVLTSEIAEKCPLFLEDLLR